MALFNRKGNLSANVTELYTERSFYAAISKDMKAASESILIESPFVTVRRASEISELFEKARKRRVKITIYTRNPSHHEGNLVLESLQGIRILRNSGAKVVACNDMRHRKIAIIDDEILWEGSLNMLSQNGSKEVMRRTNSRELCAQMKRFLGLRW